MAKIDDVAKRANVSKGTVSNFFSQKRPVSDKVKKRVLEAARELKYTPNHIARSLVTKKTMTISLNLPYSEKLTFSSFHTNLISGVIMEAAKQNYRILIDTLSQDELELPYISRDAMDGVILLNPRKEDSRIEYLNHFDIPYVVIGQPSESYLDQAAYVDNNNREIVHEITTDLLEQGHRRILFLNASPKMTVSKVREEGFCKAFEDFNVSKDLSRVVYKEDIRGDSSEYGYEEAIKHLQGKNETFTAIIADMDKVALGVSKALKKLHLNIPKDVSLVALSDDLVLSHDLDPPLSTVDMHSVELGYESVRMLFAKIGVGDFQPSNKRIIEATYHRRGSFDRAKELQD